MRKYSTPNLVKAVSLGAAIVSLLSSVSPVFAANLAITGQNNLSTNGAMVSYQYGSHGSIVFAGDDDYCGADSVVGRGGKQQQTIKESQRRTAQEQYERFVGEKQFGGRSPYGTTTERVTWEGDSWTTPIGGYMGLLTGGVSNALPEAYGIYSFATGCGSAATGNYSTAFGAGATAKAGGAQAFGVSALASGIASVAMGVDSEASGKSAVAVGGLATALGENSVSLGNRARAEKNYAIAIGSEAEARASGSIAIGSRRSDRTEGVDPERKVIAKAENAIAIGTHTYAETQDSVAIGVNAQVLVDDGVAVGGGSISNRNKGVAGYDPSSGKASTDDNIAWKSTTGAFSVGEVGLAANGTKGTLTRQITGVAAGSDDTDAVNVAQLKAMRDVIAGGGEGWKISVNDGDSAAVNGGNTVDFSVKNNNGVGKDNLKIERESSENKHNLKFTLSDTLKLSKVTTGQSSMSDDGLMIGNGAMVTVDGFLFNNGGPSMTINGIDAGNQKITKVKEGTTDLDAVNFKQLQEVKKSISKARSWKLSVENDNAKDVPPGSIINLVSGERINEFDPSVKTKNISIKRNDNKVEFDLTDHIKVKSVAAGKGVMNNGFRFAEGKGPSMEISGINAGNMQIQGVADGEEDFDAVNFKQLKEVKKSISKAGGWKLSINDDDAQDVSPGSIVNLVSRERINEFVPNIKTKNISIKRNDDKVEFDLADNIEVKSVWAGRSIVKNGFRFSEEGTPSMEIWGINAGNMQIRGVADGKMDSDAVNVAQLKAMRDVIVGGGGWKISVNDKDSAAVKGNDTVDFSVKNDNGVGKDNLKIEKENGENKHNIKFALNDALELTSVTTGQSSMSADGFIIRNGPMITINGINAGNKKITGVAAGSEDNDAVNFAQLNKVKDLISGAGGWKLSVNGGDVTDVESGSTVHFVGINAEEDNDESKNIKITKGDNNTVEFALNDIIRVKRVIAGKSNVSDNGFVITGGPNMTTGGIYAGNKKIVGVAAGTNDTDAVNYAQLQDIKYEIEENNLVKWHESDELISIGAEKLGTTIDITNVKGGERIISGVAIGKVSSDSTEAINGQQLFQLSDNISNYFGGSTDVLAGIEPTFVIQNKPYYNVTDAFTGVNVSIKNIDDKIIEMKANNLVQQEGISGIITIGAKTAGTEINIAGHDKLARKISGVQAAEKGDEAVNKDQLDKSIGKISEDALLWSEDQQAFVAIHKKDGKKTNSKLKFLLDGDIAEDSTDAITGHQLYAMSNQLAAYFGGGAKYENGKWTAPNFKISQIDANGTVKEQTHHNVADAFGDINSGMVNINNRIDNVINKVDSDALKWNDLKGAYDANHDGKPSKIINVADGNIAQGSKDAVNGGQLWETNERINGVEKDIKHIENRVDNISTTVTNIGETVVKIEDKVDHIDNKVNDLVDGVVLYDRDENGKKINKVTLKGVDESEPVTIDNVADGRIEKGSKEAVNGGQLRDYTEQQMKIILDQSKHYTDQRVNNIVVDAIDDAVERANNYTNMKFEALNYSIENVRKEAKQAAAIGLAVSNLRYNDMPGKLSVAFGSGLWRSQSAFAFGAGYTSEKGNIRSNLSVTSSGGHWGVGAGFNMTLN